MSTSLDFIIAFLLAIASGAFLAGITSFSPIYFIFGIALIFYFFKLILDFKFKLNNQIYLNIFILFFSIFSQSITPNTKITNTILLIMPYLFFIILYQCYQHISVKDMLIISFFMVVSQIVFFASDTIWRFLNPTLYATNIYSGHTRELNLAYMFKFNSIMYLDANFVGVQCCLLYFFVYYLIKEQLDIKWIKTLLYTLFALTILTTSRSAIIVIILYSIIFNKISFPFILNRKQIILASIFGLLILILISIIYMGIANDASFATKFLIINLAFDFLKGVPISTILFGIGVGNTFDFIGIGAHNLFIMLLLETGLIGLFLFLVNIYFIIKATKGKALYIILPFFTMGFSVVSIAFPYLMVQLAIIIFMTKKNTYN